MKKKATPKRGRPPLPSDSRLSPMSIGINKRVGAALRVTAQSLGVPVTTAARMLIIEALKQRKAL